MFPVHDTFDAIFLGCLFFGLIFSLASLVLGAIGAGADHHAELAHHGHGHGHDADSPLSSMLNVSSALAFITWFGGITYLARHALSVGIPVAIPLGIVGGIAGAAVIGWALFRVLPRYSEELDPRDWETLGTIGRVSSTIREGGVGEIVYELNGTRHSAPARSVSGEVLARDTEVVILRNQRGVAVVQSYDTLVEDFDQRREARDSASADPHRGMHR